MTLLKVLFVGDHTDQANWGARAQSLALTSLLEKRFEIADFIPGRVVNGDARYVRTILPSGVVRTLLYRRHRSPWVDWLVRMEERLGAGDFITGDPRESADKILRYSSRYPDVGRLRRQVEAADLVVVNGEGSGIFSTPHRRDFFFYLSMAELAIRFGKPVFVVNAILSDCPLTGRNEHSVQAAADVLRRCTDVHLRDPYSVEYAADAMPGVRCRHVPDALFTWFDRVQDPAFRPPGVGDFAVPFPEDRRWLGKLDFSGPYICVAGSSLAAYDKPRAVPRFRRLVEQLAPLGLPVYLLEACGGDSFLEQIAEETGVGFVPKTSPVVLAAAILAHARLLISGRFHTSILASLGGTPCVFLEAHSHKIRSLQASLGYNDNDVFSAFPSDDEVVQIAERTGAILSRETSDRTVRERVRDAARTRAGEAASTATVIQNALDR